MQIFTATSPRCLSVSSELAARLSFVQVSQLLFSGVSPENEILSRFVFLHWHAVGCSSLLNVLNHWQEMHSIQPSVGKIPNQWQEERTLRTRWQETCSTSGRKSTYLVARQAPNQLQDQCLPSARRCTQPMAGSVPNQWHKDYLSNDKKTFQPVAGKVLNQWQEGYVLSGRKTTWPMAGKVSTTLQEEYLTLCRNNTQPWAGRLPNQWQEKYSTSGKKSTYLVRTLEYSLAGRLPYQWQEKYLLVLSYSWRTST